MYSRLAIAVLFLLLAACDSGTSTPTTADPNIPSTTTTIENDTCGRLAVDTARYLESVVEVLDESTLAETRDRELCQEGLVALEQQGVDLDAGSTAMRCDPGQVQAAAFFAADLDPDSDLAALSPRRLGPVGTSAVLPETPLARPAHRQRVPAGV